MPPLRRDTARTGIFALVIPYVVPQPLSSVGTGQTGIFFRTSHRCSQTSQHPQGRWRVGSGQTSVPRPKAVRTAVPRPVASRSLCWREAKNGGNNGLISPDAHLPRPLGESCAEIPFGPVSSSSSLQPPAPPAAAGLSAGPLPNEDRALPVCLNWA